MSYGAASYQGGVNMNSEFKNLSTIIGQNIQIINKNTSTIDSLIDKIATQRQSQDLNNKLHNLQQETNALARKTGQLIRQLTDLGKFSSRQTQDDKIIISRHTKSFTTVLEKFQKIQRKEAENERASFRQAKVDSGFDQQSPVVNNKPLVDIGHGRAEESLQIDRQVDLKILQERESQIKKLEGDIVTVNEIFKEIGMLVHDQQEMIDSIEDNVESTTHNVEKGRMQLQKAQGYQTSARKKKLCLLIVGIVILVVLILIIYFSIKN